MIEGLGHECAVIAPSLIPRRPGELTEIWTPDEAHEALRDLVRAREAAVKDRTRKRQEIRSFLLRHGKIYPGKKAWGTKYFKWLHDLSFGWPVQKVVLHEMIVAETQSRERVARLDAAIEDALLDWSLAPVVERLQALRGVSLIVAVTFMVEVGDIRRFEHPRQLMAYLGLVPSERSTGDNVRRVLAESAWTYRHPARVEKKKYFATRHLPEAVREVAWKAQARLTRRYRALTARGKRSTVAITAVVRELVGFMWAIAMMESTEAQVPDPAVDRDPQPRLAHPCPRPPPPARGLGPSATTPRP